ncbi:MAG TPA: hypothetical protein RMG95_27010 [Polyangiaceae bacterium LLY-WYZ-15_(1-7)]|nr:hypothetical protein [Polyangiaceae bacterium LLY-WYZ-15_(1-7)]
MKLVLIAVGTKPPRWVVDGNYFTVAGTVWGRATHLVWLDYPRSLIMRRIVPRSLRRMLRGERLWAGNRERLGQLLSPDPDANPILNAWLRHPERRVQTAALLARHPHLRLVHLRHPRDADGDWPTRLARA